MKTTLMTLMFFTTILVKGQATIDLNKLTLNNSLLKELTIEKVTDMLGRPSAVVKPMKQLSDVIGPKIFYFSNGLEFLFKTNAKDSLQRLSGVTIHLTREWNEERKEFFTPFMGTLFPNLNANMKTHDILPLFKDFMVKIESAEERNKANEESNNRVNEISRTVGLPSRDFTVHHDLIGIQSSYGNVNLFCEELTKFLEYISINFDKPKL